MGNPYDPKTPLYEGQPQAQPAPQASSLAGLHFLGGLGDLVVAGAHFLTGGGDEADDEEVEEQPRPRRRFRSRVFGANSARTIKGACCRRPTGK